MAFMAKMFGTRNKKDSRPHSKENLSAPKPTTTKYNTAGAAAPIKPSYTQQVTKDIVATTVPPRHKSTIVEQIEEPAPEKVNEEVVVSPLGENNNRVSKTGNGISCGFHHVVPGIQFGQLFAPKVLPKSALPTPSIQGPPLGIQAPFQYQNEDAYQPIEFPEPKLLRGGAMQLPKIVPVGLYSAPVSAAEEEVPVAADIPAPVEIAEDVVEEPVAVVEEAEEVVEEVIEEQAVEEDAKEEEEE